MKDNVPGSGSGNLFHRKRLTGKLQLASEWDLVVIGGGATGLGVALDAVSRNLRVLLLEQSDFAKGTSSKSTKLIHGGVRYLAQGNVDLVREALYERGLLLKNAAHLVKNQTFIIPNYGFLKGPFYWIGLKIYDLLAGRLSLGRSEYISGKEVRERIPVLLREGLRNGVKYHDGQFDDARLAVNIAQTIIEKGGVAINYAEVLGLTKNNNGKITGVTVRDKETSGVFRIKSRAVVNATGVFANSILEMDDKARQPLVRPSQGAHLVLDRSFLASDDAIMIPKTPDGRVLFAVPWYNRVILGTTDIPVEGVSLEPRPMEEEISYILETAGRYLARPPRRPDILSVYAGLRPLAATKKAEGAKTKEISRSHKILVEDSGLVTITGGKWTTFRRMGEDTVDKVIALAGLPSIPSQSKDLLLHGAPLSGGDVNSIDIYGEDRKLLQQLVQENPAWGDRLHPEMPFTAAEVVLAARNEMARTIEDVLARRVRILFLDAKAAIACAPVVADLLAAELGKDSEWKESQLKQFYALAEGYLLPEMKTAPEFRKGR